MSRPALPLLLLLQLGLLGGLLALGLSSRPAPAPPVDPGRAQALLEAAAAAAVPRRALVAGDEPALASFLSLASAAGGAQAVQVNLRPGGLGGPTTRLYALVDGMVDPFDLPVVLRMVEGFKAPLAIERLELRGGPRQPMTLRLAWSALRAEAPPVVSAEGPLGPAFSAAAALRHWRAVAAALRAQTLLGRDRAALLQGALPAALIALRAEGGDLRWSPREGLRRLP